MCSKARCAKASIVILVLIIIVIAIILILKSYVSLEYYQYGFKRHVTQNVVDRTGTYGPGGRYWFGPSYNFLPLTATARHINFDEVMVFAKDKLEVAITAHLQYFLRKDQMSLLHKKFDVNFEPIISANALSALKNKAPSFHTREYMRNRSLVENELFLAIREHISGTCCEEGCTTTRTCIPGCKRFCQEDDYGFFVDVRYFQLNALELPNDLKGKFLKTQILYEEANIEQYKQEASVIRKKTDSKIKQIENEANEIRASARANSTLIVSEATANASATVENARADGLKHLYTSLSITEPLQKASFDYLRTLRRKSHIKLAVNFQQLIAGKL